MTLSKIRLQNRILLSGISAEAKSPSPNTLLMKRISKVHDFPNKSFKELLLVAQIFVAPSWLLIILEILSWSKVWNSPNLDYCRGYYLGNRTAQCCRVSTRHFKSCSTRILGAAMHCFINTICDQSRKMASLWCTNIGVNHEWIIDMKGKQLRN